MFSSGLYPLKKSRDLLVENHYIGHLSERENRAVSSGRVEELWAASLAGRETWEKAQQQNRRPAQTGSIPCLSRVSSATPVG